ncbi:DUF6735 family protein [Halorubellus sp. PRR65]|uniref:DUF6735 family protein n=1 Tax=Halorubellus sp. PRR65 TaxID=3098148 RepID=UPI002B25D98B|nr:DUF6735 family protein [Halorubellus sp. PRR65]
MGHRALVAYERPAGGFTVRYSQWGAYGYRLLEAITESTPLGGSRGDDGPSRVRPGPVGVADDLAAVAADYVDPIAHEAAFVVSDAYCVRAFEPLAFWGDAPTSAYGGALVSLRRERDPTVDARELRAWRRGATASGLPTDDAAVDAAERERTHRRLYDALEADVDGRRLEPIPPRTREA